MGCSVVIGAALIALVPVNAVRLTQQYLLTTLTGNRCTAEVAHCLLANRYKGVTVS